MKGQEWYQQEDVVESYEDKRFSRGGGRLTDRLEKEAVLRALGPVEDRDVLEIACGTGRFSVMLAERGANVVGLDISAPMLGEGRRNATRAGVSDAIEFARGDAARLPFPDDHFDAVFGVRFFHLADTPVAYLEEMARVTADEVVFDTYNRSSGRALYNWALPMGSRLYSRGDVDRMVSAADLHLTDEFHEFLVPFGLYRGLPGAIARPLRDVEEAVVGTSVGERLASISYWSASVG